MQINKKINKNILEEELFVHYVLPAYRREIIKLLVYRDEFTQKKVASILNVTEGCVSQLITLKRGAATIFNDSEIKRIKEDFKAFLEGKYESINEMIQLEGMLMSLEYKKGL